MKRRKKGGRASEPPANIAHAPAKRPGAQPGNHNAVKHGYYSSIFKATERRLLEQLPLTDLSAEIELIRVTNKRFLQALSARKDDLDFETQLTALRAVNLSAHSIATLLRAHALTAALNRDAAEAVAEGGFEPPLRIPAPRGAGTSDLDELPPDPNIEQP